MTRQRYWEGVAASGRPPAGPTDEAAFRVERVREQVDRLCWAGITMGLAFTMTNVQHFAAAGAPAWSLPWLAAWLLDPTVSLVLIAILRAEQVTARYGVRMGPWVRRAKWFTLGATYVMNTWASFVAGSWAGIVLHSVPPLLVFMAAEAVTDLRDKLTAAALAALQESKPASTGGGSHRTEIRTHAGGRRKLFADYLTEARHAWTPGIEITPAWVRQVTACSRGLSSRLAATLAAEIAEREANP
ncbi:hypothetical protein [Prauserella endophytica]|uniref:DUF2637 domain-containing protein n=1 Tax=Prauserella endophytica TaxID=1592324 RepID=A0ABY2S1B7_9PSEU|nr:hypothetical protein [Prauserella endophytica]TKG68344.1 hypothetical protein FCN18_21525 [Prauserella endophytica]